MKYWILFISILMLNLPSQGKGKGGKVDYTKFVSPFIGTQGRGHTFPGVTYPFGMVKLGPDCDNLSSNMGYRAKGKVRGFSHTHVSGTGGAAKYGNILFYPFTGKGQISDYGVMRKKELAEPGYFMTKLENHIQAELTCTEKTGIHRYTFGEKGACGILIDCGSFLKRLNGDFEKQELVGSEVNILSKTEITGYSRVRGGWNTGGAFSVYFYALFDTPANNYGTWKSGIKNEGHKSEFDSGEPVGAWFAYDNKDGKKKVLVKVGISFISTGKAKENCLREAENLSFIQAVGKAKAKWNKYLSRIKIGNDDIIENTKFYTALYHTLMQPTDRSGENPMWTNGLPYFDDFYCIWDIFRTSSPLMTLITPEKESQIVNSLIDIYEHEGYMPDGRSGNYSGRTQGGSNADMMVAEAILKDLKGIDKEKAWDAMVKNAEVPPGGNQRLEGREGLNDYKTLGYVSTDYERAGNRTVEYAANDWSIALCAKKLGKDKEYEKYSKRAANWENLWKPVESEGVKWFIMPRKANGEWDDGYLDPLVSYYRATSPAKTGILSSKDLPGKYLKHEKFSMTTKGTWPNFFYEGDSWTYSLYVPQDVKRLIEKCGGESAFISRLDTFFTNDHYEITNEPGFLAPCLYIYVGRHDKTVELINSLLKKYYTDKPDGLPGNDDSGAISSWYIFHKIGIFPVAGQDIYLIASPHFKSVSIQLGKGKRLTIEANKLSEKNIYIKKAELNGQPWNKAWFAHADIKDGGVLKFEMCDKPCGWGAVNRPPSRSDYNKK